MSSAVKAAQRALLLLSSQDMPPAEGSRFEPAMTTVHCSEQAAAVALVTCGHHRDEADVVHQVDPDEN